MVQGQRITEFSCPDAECLVLFGYKTIELLPHILEVDMNRNQRVSEIILEYAVTAIQRAIHLQVDDEVIDLPFPSMLIQPIVENAIKHGLEPKIDGGEIRIKVTKRENDRLRWEIEDTGLGMSDKVEIGTGLSNIMERVESLYGKEGHLSFKDNKPSGVKVTLELPYACA